MTRCYTLHIFQKKEEPVIRRESSESIDNILGDAAVLPASDIMKMKTDRAERHRARESCT